MAELDLVAEAHLAHVEDGADRLHHAVALAERHQAELVDLQPVIDGEHLAVAEVEEGERFGAGRGRDERVVVAGRRVPR